METREMGRVVTEATIENLGDLWDVQQGRIAPQDVRAVTVAEALVDTGATLLSLPSHLIQDLGLARKYTRRVRSSRGVCDADIYGTVKLTIGGRECPTDVIEVPDGTPVLIGQIPLEYMDFVVDPRQCRLIGNPAHGGEHMYELY